jgi:hypothetical protein
MTREPAPEFAQLTLPAGRRLPGLLQERASCRSAWVVTGAHGVLDRVVTVKESDEPAARRRVVLRMTTMVDAEASRFDVSRFTVSEGRLVAVGRVPGGSEVAMPVTSELALGHLNLDLLGNLLDAVASLDSPTRVDAILQHIATRLNQRLRALA